MTEGELVIEGTAGDGAGRGEAVPVGTARDLIKLFQSGEQRFETANAVPAGTAGYETAEGGGTMARTWELRPWRDDDAESLAQYANDPLVARNLTGKFPSPYALQDARDYIRRNQADEQTPGGRFCHCIAVNGAAAGSIDVIPGEDVYRRTAVLGYWIARDFWRQGIMTAAVGQFVREAFRRLDIVRISADAFSRNAGSRRVLEKNGFILEGIRRKNLWKDGELCDDCLYGLLREDLELS